MKTITTIGSSFLAAALLISWLGGVLLAQPAEKEGETADPQRQNVPVPAGYTHLYSFSGVRDTTIETPNTVATSVHCTNATLQPTTLYLALWDFDGDVFTQTATLLPNRTATISSQDVLLYAEDVIFNFAAASENLNQGSGHIFALGHVPLICTAHLIDPINSVPQFAVQLPLYDRHGELVKHRPPFFTSLHLPLITRP
jgi:hypothetical protein